MEQGEEQKRQLGKAARCHEGTRGSKRNQLVRFSFPGRPSHSDQRNMSWQLTPVAATNTGSPSQCNRRGRSFKWHVVNHRADVPLRNRAVCLSWKSWTSLLQSSWDCLCKWITNRKGLERMKTVTAWVKKINWVAGMKRTLLWWAPKLSPYLSRVRDITMGKILFSEISSFAFHWKPLHMQQRKIIEWFYFQFTYKYVILFRKDGADRP